MGWLSCRFHTQKGQRCIWLSAYGLNTLALHFLLSSSPLNIPQSLVPCPMSGL